jgi:hypothetical protein
MRDSAPGPRLARLLAGLWRRQPSLDGTAAAELAAHLLATGLGGLVGRLVSPASVRALRLFREEYRALAAQSVQREGLLAGAVRALRAAGIEAVLVKGLSVSRHYPDAGCRPVGDVDLCVPPGLLEAAIGALTNSRLPTGLIDLHEGVPDLKGRSWEGLLRRSRLLEAGGERVRILGEEDLLRLVCLHFVRHLGERPLWLTDVAVLLESMSPGFDWPLCLEGPASQARWVLAVVGLARSLLGAAPVVAPPASPPPPAWLAECVLAEWGRDTGAPRTILHPMRAAWRLGVGPLRSTLLLRLGAVLLLPLQVVARLRRLGTRRRPLPLSVHEERLL